MALTIQEIYQQLRLPSELVEGGDLDVHSPINGALMAKVACDTKESVGDKVAQSEEAFRAWRQVPAPRRGELVRLLGEVLREYKHPLGALVSAEAGKILEEGLGEVQEMIDICDFAVGLSRQLYGLTIASERPGHHMREYWHPLGPVGIISAFNFPVAVWSWNSALALVCGDSILWKPSEKTPVTALACQHLFMMAVERFGDDAPEGLSQIIIGAKDIGEVMVDDERVPLISATGSTRMGREVGPRVASRFGKTILELGGNNAIIISDKADQDMAITGIVFGAVGTCGQRCTSTRRLFVHEAIYDEFVARLKAAYGKITIGNPLEGHLVGPLIDADSFNNFEKALQKAAAEGGVITGGGRALVDQYPDAFYVNPALVEMPEQTSIVQNETFAPILYVMKYSNLEDAIAKQNAVKQGLSSAIFSTDVRETELFTSAVGSDCGIVNVNIGTSGAEIGGAFGGEKETGGGRESGSDAWKAYMRRATSTVNYSRELPLAQGIKFDL